MNNLNRIEIYYREKIQIFEFKFKNLNLNKIVVTFRKMQM